LLREGFVENCLDFVQDRDALDIVGSKQQLKGYDTENIPPACGTIIGHTRSKPDPSIYSQKVKFISLVPGARGIVQSIAS